MNPAERLFIGRYISDPKRNLLRFSFLFMILGIVISVGILTAALNITHIVNQNQRAGRHAVDGYGIDRHMNQTAGQLQKRRRFIDG